MNQEKLHHFLQNISKDAHTHAKFLNTLSFLEYIGARKILKSLQAPLLNETLLGHIAEEAYHSLFFKKLARKVCKKQFSFEEEEMLAGRNMESYFQSLDQKACEMTKNQKFLNYLYTTWIIEKRAVTTYKIYNQILKENKFPFTLNSILRDEDKHLEEVETTIKKQDPDHDKHFALLKNFEAKEFDKVMQSLQESVPN